MRNKINSYNGDVMQNLQGGLKVIPTIKLSLIKRLRLIIVFINFNPLQHGVAYLYPMKTENLSDVFRGCRKPEGFLMFSEDKKKQRKL